MGPGKPGGPCTTKVCVTNSLKPLSQGRTTPIRADALA